MISNPRTYKRSYGFGQNHVTWNNVSNQKLQNFKNKTIVRFLFRADNRIIVIYNRIIVKILITLIPKFCPSRIWMVEDLKRLFKSCKL